MLIAKAKRQENIIEYLLYMYQVEDIIRSFQFNMDMINQAVVEKFDQPEAVKSEIRSWYEELSQQMQEQGLKRKGHLKFLRDLIAELQDLHDQLSTTFFDKQYIDLYDAAKPYLKELTVKSVGQSLSNQIDVAVHGVYGFLMLRLKKQEISSETEKAMEKITGFLAYLAACFHKKEAGLLNLSKVQGN